MTKAPVTVAELGMLLKSQRTRQWRLLGPPFARQKSSAPWLASGAARAIVASAVGVKFTWLVLLLLETIATSSADKPEPQPMLSAQSAKPAPAIASFSKCCRAASST